MAPNCERRHEVKLFAIYGLDSRTDPGSEATGIKRSTCCYLRFGGRLAGQVGGGWFRVWLLPLPWRSHCMVGRHMDVAKIRTYGWVRSPCSPPRSRSWCSGRPRLVRPVPTRASLSIRATSPEAPVRSRLTGGGAFQLLLYPPRPLGRRFQLY